MSTASQAADRLDSILTMVTAELEQFRRSTQPAKLAASQRNERMNLEIVLGESQKALDGFNAGIENTLASMRAVAATSTIELQAGFVSNSPESVIEVKRLATHLGDLLLGLARKQRQHETLLARIGPIVNDEVEAVVVEDEGAAA